MMMMMIFENLQYHGWFALSQKSPQGQIVPLHWRYHNISPQGKISQACNHSTIAIRMFIAQYILGENPFINFCVKKIFDANMIQK